MDLAYRDPMDLTSHGHNDLHSFAHVERPAQAYGYQDPHMPLETDSRTQSDFGEKSLSEPHTCFGIGIMPIMERRGDEMVLSEQTVAMLSAESEASYNSFINSSFFSTITSCSSCISLRDLSHLMLKLHVLWKSHLMSFSTQA